MTQMQQGACSRPATVELDGGVRLVGSLSAQSGDSLLLSSAKIVQDPGGAITLRADAPARVWLEGDVPDWDSSQSVAVAVSSISDSGESSDSRSKIVSLRLSYPESEVARRCLALLESADAAASAGADDEELLNEFTELSLEQLRDQFSGFLNELRLQLMELALRRSSWGQSGFDEAADAVKNNRNTIVDSVVAEIRSHYADLTPREVEPQPEELETAEDNLGLVDIDEFEHGLSLERIVRRGSERYEVPLECLTLRFAKLVNVEPGELRLPVHVRQLSRAFHHALQNLEIPHRAAATIFESFEKHFIQRLDLFFERLNKLLAKGGILPEVEREIAQKGSLLRQPGLIQRSPDRGPKPRARTEETEPGPTTDEAPQGTAPGESQVAPGPVAASANMPPWPAPDGTAMSAREDYSQRLYNSLMAALQQRRASAATSAAFTEAGAAAPMSSAAPAPGSAPAPIAAPPPSAAPAPAEAPASSAAATVQRQDLARVLAALQQDPGSSRALQHSASLRDFISSQLGQLPGLPQGAQLAADALDQIDMVDNLFQTIDSRMQSETELQPAMEQLQLPLARVAMQEPGFLLNRDHPARNVVDKLERLSSTASFPNRALESRIDEIVTEIARDYTDDSAVFARAAERIDRLLEQQERMLSRNIDRVIRTQEGQEKLAMARREVDAAIRESLPTEQVPEVLLNLIDEGWRDLLVLTHVREGRDSGIWQDELQTLQNVAQHLQQVHEGSPDVGPEQSDALVAELSERLGATLPTNIAYQSSLKQLAAILRGDEPLSMQAVAAPAEEASPAAVRERLDDLPRLRRWVRRVEDLQTGNWLSYRDKDGQARRMQLAWVSPHKDRFIFVNERGQKNADLSAIQLARQLSRGVKPPSPSETLGLVDRSVYETLEDVQKSLSFERNHDALTRLINRETFLEQMSRALIHARKRGSQHSVLYLDIDQFNLVNELYDRVSGDQVLLEFAGLLSQLHGKKTSSARLQEDEFGVLLVGRTPEQAQQVADKIRSDIEQASIGIDGENVSFTVSIGIAPILEHSPDVEQILDAARGAMQIAKQQGRNRVVTYTQDQSQAKLYRRDKDRTRQDLEQALETDRFVLRAQPIVQTAMDGSAVLDHRYELLLGWRDKQGALASPQEFIRSAERYGFMTLVDRWVVREAFGWISRLMDEQKVVPHLSINLSGGSITSDSFMEFLLEQISEFGVGTDRICFEITEAGTISNLVKAADFVRAFRNIGCKFSVDDFGTGLASHDFLRDLPVDFVKIDGAFIKDIDSNRNDYAMARSINDLAHFLGQETIAESVENESIIDRLREIGVDYLQGWGIARPQLLEDITAEISSLEK